MMKLFRLDKRLLTGMALIDEQHRQYGKFVNAFLKVCQKHDHVAEGALRKAFTFLHVYARQHLQEEAALMETYAYPGRVEHLERHHFFSAWIDQTEVQLANGSQAAAAKATRHNRGTSQRRVIITGYYSGGRGEPKRRG